MVCAPYYSPKLVTREEKPCKLCTIHFLNLQHEKNCCMTIYGGLRRATSHCILQCNIVVLHFEHECCPLTSEWLARLSTSVVHEPVGPNLLAGVTLRGLKTTERKSLTFVGLSAYNVLYSKLFWVKNVWPKALSKGSSVLSSLWMLKNPHCSVHHSRKLGLSFCDLI